MADIVELNNSRLVKYGKFIKAFPCFAMLTQQQTLEFAALMQKIIIPARQVIVKENDLVDSIYIILKGEAEVSREMTTKTRFKRKNKNIVSQIPIAALRSGEGIGLHDTGFYSLTGKRTATVTAVTAMQLLKLDVNELYQFLKKNNLESNMYAASQQMQRMRFIKQSLPFSKLSHERLEWLAKHVEEESVAAGDVIFKEGDRGDRCYLIRSGKIEITIKNESKQEHQVAILKPPVLFGEATLITHSPRNATARALEKSDLFMLRHEYLSELIETEKNVANMFMTLMVDRSRPLKNPDVTTHHRTTADGQEVTILKNPENSSYFNLSAEGNFIWDELDGHHTMQDITLNLAEKFNVFAPDVVAALISRLTKSGFISNLEISNMANSTSQPLWVKAMLKVRQVLEARYAFGDADSRMTSIYNKYIHFLFSKIGLLILAILVVSGLVAFAYYTPNILLFFSFKHVSLFLILGLIPLSIVEVLLHELGHAFTVKAFGREVHYIGVGWYWFAPIAFTDTTDMWLSNRKQRMLVNLAGVFVDVLVAGIASIVILFIENYPFIQAMLWLFALYTYIGAIRMLSPLQDLDGYYILMDYVEKPKLRKAAVIWLVKVFPKCLREPHLFSLYKPEIIYWLACLGYLIILSVLTLTVLAFVFAIIGMQANPYLSLALPFIVVIFSSLTIIADIRNQAEE